MYSTLVDCFCVTESWLTANVSSGEVLPSNYVIIVMIEVLEVVVCLLLGNFNFPDVNWNTFCVSSLHSSSLCDCFFNKNLIQMDTGSTHYLGNTLGSCSHQQSKYDISSPCASTVGF